MKWKRSWHLDENATGNYAYMKLVAMPHTVRPHTSSHVDSMQVPTLPIAIPTPTTYIYKASQGSVGTTTRNISYIVFLGRSRMRDVVKNEYCRN